MRALLYSIQYNNLLKKKPGCFLPFSYVGRISSVQYIPLSHIKEYRCLKKVVHKKDKKMNCCSLQQISTVKFELAFVFSQENGLSYRFHFKPKRKSISSSKKIVLGISKIALILRDWHVFMWQPQEILNIFYTLTLKQILWNTKTFFKKKLEHRFLIQSSKIKKTTFPYKTVLSEGNGKTNRMGSTKWTYRKKYNFASN